MKQDFSCSTADSSQSQGPWSEPKAKESQTNTTKTNVAQTRPQYPQLPHLLLLLISLPREPVTSHMLVVVDLDSDDATFSTLDLVKLQNII